MTRDAQGKIQTLTSAAQAGAEGRTDPVESVIMVECDRIVRAQDQQALCDEIQRVLGDVRAAVQDGGRCLARAQAVAAAAYNRACCPTPGATKVWNFCAGWKIATSPSWAHGTMTSNATAQGVSLVAKPDSGLGILRGPVRPRDQAASASRCATGIERTGAHYQKAMTRATVHRPRGWTTSRSSV